MTSMVMTKGVTGILALVMLATSFAAPLFQIPNPNDRLYHNIFDEDDRDRAPWQIEWDSINRLILIIKDGQWEYDTEADERQGVNEIIGDSIHRWVNEHMDQHRIREWNNGTPQERQKYMPLVNRFIKEIKENIDTEHIIKRVNDEFK